MKTLLLILAMAVMALAGQCNQVYSDRNIQFRCEDGTWILMLAPQDKHGAREIYMLRIVRWKDGSPTLTIYHEDFTYDECKEKYYYVKEVMDELTILQDKKVVCTGKSEYKPRNAWNKLKKEYTFKYMTPEEMEKAKEEQIRAALSSSSSSNDADDNVDDYDLNEEEL